jgi:hypothetical protein
LLAELPEIFTAKEISEIDSIIGINFEPNDYPDDPESYDFDINTATIITRSSKKINEPPFKRFVDSLNRHAREKVIKLRHKHPVGFSHFFYPDKEALSMEDVFYLLGDFKIKPKFDPHNKIIKLIAGAI